MKRKKIILVVTGSRAEYGLLRGTMDAIRAHPRLTLAVLATGMHTLRSRGRTELEIRKDGYPLRSVAPVRETDDMLKALAREIDGIRSYCLRTRPNAILVLGDRDEPLAAVLVAAHLGIPTAHIHGGDRSGGVDESVRHAITKFAHLHFPATRASAARLRAFGEEPRRIHTVGAPGLEDVADERHRKSLPSRAALAVRLGLDPSRQWLVVIHHPTVSDAAPLARQITSLLEALRRFPEHEKIMVLPNTDTGHEVFLKKLSSARGVRYHRFPSLPRELYLAVVSESDAIIGNSSGGLIEAPTLGTPAVNIGSRQKGRERGGSVIDVPYEARAIARAIGRAIAHKRKRRGKPFPSPYGKGGTGKRIAALLARFLEDPRLLQKPDPIGRARGVPSHTVDTTTARRR